MSIDPSIFKAYDIRAIYPTQIDEGRIVNITRAVYKVVSDKSGKNPLTFALSRDMRISSPSLFEAALKTLIEMGANVIDLGLSSTPNLYFSVYSEGYDGGMQISASHNPKEWNGIKIVMNSTKGLIKIGKNTGMEDIKNLSNQNFSWKSPQKGTVVRNDTLEKEVNNALRITGNPKISEFNIVADGANSMGTTYINALFKRIPGNLTRLNFELDGNFPAHQPDPLNYETLTELRDKVVSERADMGFAPDGDGDRFFFIDENGDVVTPSIINSIVAREWLKKHSGATILFDIRYIFQLTKIVEENGGKYGITKVGHAFITEKMHETGADYAGESSCHFFFKETGNGEAPLPVVITVLSVMTREGKKLSEISKELKRAFESGEFNYKVSNAKDIMEELKRQYSDGKVEDWDGVAVTYPSWRFSVRSSNTEPLLRLNVESYNKEEMETKRDELKSFIDEKGAKE